MNNSIGWAREERWAGRPTKRVSGVYEKLKARGAEFGFHAGRLLVLEISDYQSNLLRAGSKWKPRYKIEGLHETARKFVVTLCKSYFEIVVTLCKSYF